MNADGFNFLLETIMAVGLIGLFGFMSMGFNAGKILRELKKMNAKLDRRGN